MELVGANFHLVGVTADVNPNGESREYEGRYFYGDVFSIIATRLFGSERDAILD